MLPAELQSLLDQMDACERDAEAILADLDDDGVNWQPGGGTGWSVAQCLNHLIVSNGMYLNGVAERMQAARTANAGTFNGLGPTAIGRWFVNSLEPPPRFKMKAPRKIRPGATFPRDGLLAAYKLSHTTYRALVNEAATVDVNRVIFPNPFLPAVKMRLATGFLVIAAHDRRHIYQAKNVKAALRGHDR